MLRRHPAPAAAPVQPAPPALDRARVLQALHEALAPSLEGAGFRRRAGQGVYELAAPAARFQVHLQCESRAPTHEVSVHPRLVLPGTRPLALMQWLAPDGTRVSLNVPALATAHGLGTLADPTAHERDRCVETPDDLDALCRRWQRLIEGAVLPLVGRCASVQGLEQALREQPAWFGPNLVSLVLAAALGREDLDAIVRRLCQHTTIHWHDRAREWLAFLKSPATVDLGPALADAASALQAWPVPVCGRPLLPPGHDGLGPEFEDQPVVSRWIGAHVVAYAVDQDGRVALVRQRHLQALGSSGKALHEQALARLAAEAAAGAAVLPQDAVLRLRLDGRHDAGLILLPALWQDLLARHAPNGALVALPSQGELLFCDVSAAGGLPALRAGLSRRQADGTRLLSATVFFVHRGGVQALPPPRE